MPILSIVIPCFNSGATLEETLESVWNQDFDNWEAIIVNDGSTDCSEDIANKWLRKDSRFKYYFKKNEGLGKARNLGIEKAEGAYILPLDSDNRIRPDFCVKAVELFETSSSVGVVYGNATYIGEKQGLWEVEDYNFDSILVKNYIDACAIFKKSLWSKVGGYDVNMPYQGNEDWEFWIALGQIGTQFYKLNAVTFEYRVSEGSMINSFSKEMFQANRDYIRKKYSEDYYVHFKKHKELIDLYNARPLKTAVIFLSKWIKSLV